MDSILSTTALCCCKPLIGQLIFTLQFVPRKESKVIIKENKNIYEPTICLTIESSSSSSSSSLLSDSDERVTQGVDSESSITITDSSKNIKYI
jgi:hypothetical protein